MLDDGYGEIAEDEIEVIKEFSNYYGAAPVTAWIFRHAHRKHLTKLVSCGHKVFMFAGNSDSAKA